MAIEILNEPIDVIENKINRLSPVLLKILLKDQTTKENIKWATSTYEKFGRSFAPDRSMQVEQLIGPNINLLTPRVSKSTEEQLERTKQKGEVFTPAWCCNYMNNYLDEDWFGKKNVFNKEQNDGWKTRKKKISFPKKLKKTWEDYVTNVRLEITCGEAPYLASRYDVVKGEIIPVENRVGLLDRKLRIINENIDNESEWLNWAERAYKSIYGFDFQGDNVLIARENLLYTLVDNMVYKFHHQPNLETLKRFAKILSWNIWQMDGFDFSAPFSEKEAEDDIRLFYIETEEKKKEKDYSIIFNWETSKKVLFKKLLEGDSSMKFDYIIGNPPYNDTQQGDNDFTKPVYNLFMDSAYRIGKKVELIHPGRFLFNAGSTPVEWNRRILNDKHFKIIKYEIDSKTIFKDQDIMGGIAISYRDANKDFGAIIEFVSFKELESIKNKINITKEEDSLISIIYLQNKYDLLKVLAENPKCKKQISSDGKDPRFRSNAFEKVEVFEEKESIDSIRVYGAINKKRTVRYIKKDYVNTEHNNFEKYKVLVPAGNGSGAIGKTIPTPLIGDSFVIKPFEAYTQTYIGVGAFNNETEACNCLKYIKTKFCRATLGILKITQANNKDTWKYVPIQNFTKKSDIDWSQNIRDIDKQLYKKYNLTKDEIDFVEKHLKEME